MALHAQDLRLSGPWPFTGPGDRHWTYAQGVRADLGREAGNRRACSGPHRGRVGLGEGARTSRRGEPGALARPSRQAAAGAIEGPPVEHHAALPFVDLPAFMGRLGKQEGTAARALTFTILTAARTGETIGAKWGEIDLTAKVWTIPAGRMKAGKEHRVPLAPEAIAILEQAAEHRENDYVFPGARGAGLSNMSFLVLLRRMGRADLTTHGFRSTFRDWAAERTGFSREVAEQALAHACPTRSRPLTAAVICSTSDEGSWRLGRARVRNPCRRAPPSLRCAFRPNWAAAMVSDGSDAKFLRLAKQAGLQGRSAAKLARAIESAAGVHALDKDFRQGGLNRRRREDGDLCSRSQTTRPIWPACCAVQPCTRKFVAASKSLPFTARAALDEQAGTNSAFALSILPQAFDAFAERAKTAAEKKAAAAATRPSRRGRPPIAVSRERLSSQLRRLVLAHSPSLDHDPKALETWLIDAMAACGATVPETRWRLLKLIGRK